MNTIRGAVVVASIGGAAAVAACTLTVTSNLPVVPDASSPDDSSVGDSATADSSTDGGDAADTAVPTAYVRLAHLSPDAPAVDFCLAPHGTTTFSGPMLAAVIAGDGGVDASALDDGGAPGLAYAQVSAYFPVTPGQYDVRLVAAGAVSCATGLVGDATSLPTLTTSSYTFAAVGDLSPAGSDPALSIKAFTDDVIVSSTQIAFRFVHASPSLPALDMGMGSLGLVDFQPLFTNVTFGTAGAQSDAGVPDMDGYLTLQPVSSQPFSAHTTVGGTSDSVVVAFSASAGAVVTTFAVGAKTGDSNHPLQFLVCMDNAPSEGLLSSCPVLAP